MWWFACAFIWCLSVVLCDEPENARSADAVESWLAANKDFLVQHLSDKMTFRRQKNSFFDAFCIEDILQCELTQKYEVDGVTTYRFNAIILGGLGDEDSIGKCLDPGVFMRSLEVSLLFTAEKNSKRPLTSTFSLNDVRITEREANAMTSWLNSNPHEVQKLIEEEKLKIDQVPPADFFRVIARHFPRAPWTKRHTMLRSNKPTWQVNAPPMQVKNPVLRVNIPPSQENNALQRRDDPLRRGGKAKRKKLATINTR